MAEVKDTQKQQNLENIKLVAKLNTDGLIPSLFREVKKAKQQLSSFCDGLKEKFNNFKKENSTKVEVKKQEVKVEPAVQKTVEKVEIKKPLQRLIFTVLY